MDLTNALGPKVAAFNRQNPDSPIKLLAKTEFRNPASQSHKERIARAMIARAEERGELADVNGNKKTSKLRLHIISMPSCSTVLPALLPDDLTEIKHFIGSI